MDGVVCTEAEMLQVIVVELLIEMEEHRGIKAETRAVEKRMNEIRAHLSRIRGLFMLK